MNEQIANKSQKTILLTGMGSATNKGTAATVVSTVNHLKEFLPNSKIYVELFYPEKQRELINIESETVHIIAPPLQSPVKSFVPITLAIVQWFMRKLRVKLHINFGCLEMYQKADVIINVGGDGFVNIYNERMLERTVRYLFGLYPLLIAVALKKPFIFHASSLGPFGIFRPVMKFMLGRAQLITVRDWLSREHLRKAGIDVSQVYVTADPAFLLKSAPDNLVMDTLKKEGIDWMNMKKDGKLIIGLVHSRLFGFRGEILKFNDDYLVRTIAKTVDRLIESSEAEVIFITRNSGKVRKQSNDVYVGMSIMHCLYHKKNFKIIRGDYPPELLKGIIGKCDVLLSFHMHPVISALSSSVPSVIIAFSDKAYGVMQKFGLNEYVCDIRSLKSEVLFGKVYRAISKKKEIQNKLKRTIKDVEKEALSGYALIKRSLE